MNKYALRQAPLSLAVGAALATGGVQAATITVTTNADAPVGTVADGCTLRDAVESANTGDAIGGCAAGSTGANEIEFAADLVDATITLSEGQMVITSPVTISGPVPEDPTGLTVDADEQSRVFRVDEVDFGLQGLTLSGGLVSDPDIGESDLHGGAMAVYYAETVELMNVLITGNAVTGNSAGGGGLYVVGSDFTLARSEISGNVVEHPAGIGGGAQILGGETSILSSTISGNSSTGRGGGLFVSSDLTMSHSQVTGNSTSEDGGRGGGLHINPAFGTTAEIRNSAISSNSTEGQYARGGGLHVDGSVMIVDTEVTANSTEGGDSAGGGIDIRFPEVVEVIGSTIAGNSASDYSDGGGMAVRYGEPEISIANSTISGNEVIDGDGGGIFVYTDAPAETSLTLTHVTAVDNEDLKYSDSVGDAVYMAGGELNLYNSLLIGGGEACNALADEFHNTLVTDESCTGTGLSEDAMALADLADNGGPTRTHALGDDSIAIDGAGACDTEFVDVDQRGVPRPAPGSSACDVGAFELGGAAVFRDRFEP